MLEVNPRASRTVPFLSKVTGVPMVRLATRVALGESLDSLGYKTGLLPPAPLSNRIRTDLSCSKAASAPAYVGSA